MVIVAAWRCSRRWAVSACCWVIAYSMLGLIQRERAEAFAWQIAKQRGHHPDVVAAKPSFANLLVWKTFYATETKYYVDAVRVAWNLTLYQGSSIKKLDFARDLPWLDTHSQQAKDIERFRWFSNGYIALSSEYPSRIIDIRYSLLPNEIKGLWGVELSPSATPHEHIHYVENRVRDEQTWSRLWSMMLGREPEQ